MRTRRSLPHSEHRMIHPWHHPDRRIQTNTAHPCYHCLLLLLTVNLGVYLQLYKCVETIDEEHTLETIG